MTDLRQLMLEFEQLILDFEQAAQALPAAPPPPDLRDRYRAGVKLLRWLDHPDDRIDVLVAIVWPRSPRLRGEGE